MVHSEELVRTALHHSLQGIGQHNVHLFPTIQSAQEYCRGVRPDLVLLPMSEESLVWAASLRSRFMAPVVFALSLGQEATLCSLAMSQGLQHFVELPDDETSTSICNTAEVWATLELAMEEHHERSRTLTRTTTVMPAASQISPTRRPQTATRVERHRRG